MESHHHSKLVRRLIPSRRDWLMMFIGAVIAIAGFQVKNMIDNARLPLPAKQAEITISWLPETVTRWNDLTIEMARKYDIDPNLLAIIMTLESGGYSKASSESDAKGLMQITPPTAKDIAAKFLIEPVDSYDLLDPRTNIEFGAAYLSYLRKEFGDANQGPSWNYTVELIAAGYNGGPGAANKVYKGEGLEDTQTVVYSRDAFNMWRERWASKSHTFDRWQERGGSELINKAKKEVNS